MKDVIGKIEYFVLDFFWHVGIAALVYGMIYWVMHNVMKYSGNTIYILAILVILVFAGDKVLGVVGNKRKAIGNN